MIDEMYKKSPNGLLHIQHFLSANCFGDFYTRAGLDLKMRELVTLAILVASGGLDAHVQKARSRQCKYRQRPRRAHMMSSRSCCPGWATTANPECARCRERGGAR